MHLSSRSLKAGSRCQERRLFLFFLLEATSWAKWTFQPSLKFTRTGNFWRLGETDASTPSCALSLHHRQVQAPKPAGLKPPGESWEPCTGMCTPFSSLLFWGFTSRHEVLHRAHRVLLWSSTLLGIEGSPPAVQTKSRAWPVCYCWSRKAKLYEGRRETQEREGQAGRVTQEVRWQTQTGSRPSRLVKDQYYPFFHSILQDLQNTTR